MHFSGGEMLKACFVFLLKNPAYGRLYTEAFCRKNFRLRPAYEKLKNVCLVLFINAFCVFLY